MTRKRATPAPSAPKYDGPLRTIDGAPPAYAMDFSSYQGEWMIPPDERYRGIDAQIGVLALNNGKFLGHPAHGFGTYNPQFDTREAALRASVAAVVRRFRSMAGRGGKAWAVPRCPLEHANYVIGWALGILQRPKRRLYAPRLPYHPLANIFPMMTPRERTELVADMRANGYRVGEEIVLLDGMILDGRNRYDAAIEAGIFPAGVDPAGRWEFIQFSADGMDGVFSTEDIKRGPLAYVLSKNLHRRHLDESQRALVSARLATMRQGERTDREPSANLRKVDQKTAAELLNVSERSLQSAKAVLDHGTPELVRAVEHGMLPVSAGAQAAKLAPETQRKVAAEAEAGRANVVRTVIKTEARDAREKERGEKQRALPDKRYGLIGADPEWRFKPRSRVTGMDRAPDNHYSTSPTEVIAARPVASIAADDAVLALWATAPMLPDALAVMQAWGFTYKTHLIWRKIRPGAGRGPGYWFTGEHELLLIGTRGNVDAPATALCGSVIDAPVAEHSAKPEIFLELLEHAFPTYTKIELNRRGPPREGWDAWGEEAEPSPAVHLVDPAMARLRPCGDSSARGRNCGSCEYRAGETACRKVAGAIAPDRLCNLYRPIPHVIVAPAPKDRPTADEITEWKALGSVEAGIGIAGPIVAELAARGLIAGDPPKITAAGIERSRALDARIQPQESGPEEPVSPPPHTPAVPARVELPDIPDFLDRRKTGAAA